MNEIIFFTQTLLIIGFTLVALQLGKSALTAWVIIQSLLANLFVLKQIPLLGCTVTASDSFAIGSFLGLLFLQEFFGKEEVKKTIWIGFFFLLFFVLASRLHLLYQPSPYDTSHRAFVTILSPSPRLFIASLSVFFLVQQIDIRVFSLLKEICPRWSLASRTTITLVISQFLDTILFSFAGLYGIVASLIDIILISFLVKFLIISLWTPFIRWAKA